MYFEPGNRYLLTNIESDSGNMVHDQIVGRICELVSFRLNESGYFKVEIDGEFHRLYTSDVKDVDATDFANEVTVTTLNSVYSFSKIFDAPSEPKEPENA